MPETDLVGRLDDDIIEDVVPYYSAAGDIWWADEPQRIRWVAQTHRENPGERYNVDGPIYGFERLQQQDIVASSQERLDELSALAGRLTDRLSPQPQRAPRRVPPLFRDTPVSPPYAMPDYAPIQEAAIPTRTRFPAVQETYPDLTVDHIAANGYYGASSLADYVAKAGPAITFLRRAASGKYSGNALMRLLTLSETVSERSPQLVVLHRPYLYDEDTEVKSGGTLGVAAVLFGDGGVTAYMAVASAHRNNGIGSYLLDQVVDRISYDPAWWVHSTNPDALRLLVKRGFYPSEMTSSGAMRLTRSGERTAVDEAQ